MKPVKKFALRKNYFIKKAFQTKFIIGFIALLFIEAFLIAMLFIHMSGETLTTGYSGSHFVIEKTSSFFVVSFLIITLVVGTAMALAGSLILVFLSHRIAGPLFRFEKSLDEISAGDLSVRVNLRKTDQLKEMQSALNRAFDNLDTRLKEIKGAADDAYDLTGKYGNEKNMQEVKDAIFRIKEKTSFFKTS